MSKPFFLIIGASGSGKTTIAEALGEMGLTSVQSYTTRASRYDGESGHVFVSPNSFPTRNELVAYTNYSGNDYGATIQQVEENDLYVIDIDGVKFFKKAYTGDKDVYIIHIASPIHTRVERMEARGDDFGHIMERIVEDVVAFRDAKDIANTTITNGDDDTIESVTNAVWNYIKAIRGE